MSRYFTKSLAALKPYTPGEQPRDQQYIKLNTNESPFAPSPRVVAAITGQEVEKLRLYSDPACRDLIAAIAARNGIRPEQVTVGNGSDEVLAFALRAFCDGDTPLAYSDITYGCYGVWCGLLGIPSRVIPLREDYTVDISRYRALGATIMTVSYTHLDVYKRQECGCGHHHHDHDADDVFTSWGRETVKKYTRAELEFALNSLDSGEFGAVLRAKGIVAGDEGWYQFDYVPGEHEVRASAPDVAGRLCVIGSDLKEEGLAQLFRC